MNKLIQNNLTKQTGKVTTPQFFLGKSQDFENEKQYADCPNPDYDAEHALVTCTDTLHYSLLGIFVTNEEFIQSNFTAFTENGEETIEYLNVNPLNPKLGSAVNTVLVIVIVFGIVSYYVQEKAIDKADERIQSAQDYSVEIIDPLKDEYNPDVYKVEA